MITQTKPIELYFWTTPNGYKISIMLEELGVPYVVRPVNIETGEQFAPEFLAISPNNRIPAIIDPEGPDGKPISIFESGAILKYLAEKFGHFYPSDKRARIKTDEWLFWQMGGFGPMLGQVHHFAHSSRDDVAYATERYVNETKRLYKVLNTQLEGREYITGEYSIADIACFSWAIRHKKHLVDLAEYPNVEAWYARISDREAVKRGLAVGKA